MNVGTLDACGCVCLPIDEAKAAKRQTSEARFCSTVLARLEPHFRVHREIGGRHPSGRRIVIDAIVEPRFAHLWRNPKVALGIEFKNELRLSGPKAINGWLAQCADYSNTCFERGFGFIPIFTCPSLVEQVESEEQRTLLTHMMGEFGIGELRSDPYRGWSFIQYGDCRIWSEAEGVEEGRTLALTRKVGSR